MPNPGPKDGWSGAVLFNQVKFADDKKQALRDIVDSEHFVKQTEGFATQAKAFIKSDKGAPNNAEVTVTIKRIHELAEALELALFNCDTRTTSFVMQSLLLHNEDWTILENAPRNVHQISNAFGIGLKEISLSPKIFKRQNTSLTNLAIQIHKALTSHGIKPSLTRGGPWYKCFEIACDAIGENREDHLNTLRKTKKIMDTDLT